MTLPADSHRYKFNVPDRLTITQYEQYLRTGRNNAHRLEELLNAAAKQTPSDRSYVKWMIDRIQHSQGFDSTLEALKKAHVLRWGPTTPDEGKTPEGQ